MFPTAIGAVVDGESCDCQTPLSGHFCPVDAVVPTPAMDVSVYKQQNSCNLFLCKKAELASHK